jgi:ribulose-5-phosphate 4-epimerase/fuculose-1-phosphate aldolase
MKSILENRPALAAEVNKVAEVAGYLWQKGWAERNGGNTGESARNPLPKLRPKNWLYHNTPAKAQNKTLFT